MKRGRVTVVCSWMATGLLACGRVAPAQWPLVASVAPVAPAAAIAPTEDAVVVTDDFAATVTTSSAELVAFVEREMGALPAGGKEDLSEPRPTSPSTQVATRLKTKTFACFALRTAKDARATVVPLSRGGFVVPPRAWLAASVAIAGAKDDDLRAWYAEMSERLAHEGRATGFARFANGNAMEITLELRDRDDTDVEIMAVTRFRKAGAYVVRPSDPLIDGAVNVKTVRYDKHEGVSVFDVLRRRSDEKPTTTTST